MHTAWIITGGVHYVVLTVFIRPSLGAVASLEFVARAAELEIRSWGTYTGISGPGAAAAR